MKKTLSLILCAILMISCVFTLFSCGEDYEHYEYELAKANKIVINGEDYTEMLSDSVDGFISADYKKSTIDLGPETIVLKGSGSGNEEKYSYTMDGNEIVIKNKSSYIPPVLGLSDVKMNFYKRDSQIEYVCSGSMIVDGTTIFLDISFFFKK